MFDKPWFLSIVAGLIVVFAMYYFNKQQQQNDDKNYTNVQLAVVFLLVSGMVYGSCMIVGKCDGLSLKDCGNTVVNDIYTGVPNWN